MVEALVLAVLLPLVAACVIALPLWVYWDARRRGAGGAALWALVAFVGGVFGVRLYLAAGREAEAAGVERASRE